MVNFSQECKVGSIRAILRELKPSTSNPQYALAYLKPGKPSLAANILFG